MLYIIGLGLNPRQLTLEALDAIKNCVAVFLESYTSRYSEGTASDLLEITGKKIISLPREMVENPTQLLAQATRENIALLVYGNPLTATTHIQLLLDAKKEGIKTTVIPGVSITNYLGKTGLDSYRFGRTATIVMPEENYEPESFYSMIEANLKGNLHTLCLLDIKEDGRLMGTSEALAILERIEKKRGTSILKDATIVILCGAGNKGETIKAGKFSEIKKSGYDVYPQSLVVCAKLNEKEKEALESLHNYKA